MADPTAPPAPADAHLDLDYPAVNGRVVTEAHARICRERGHARYTRAGRDTGMCPRCGELTGTEDATEHDPTCVGCHTPPASGPPITQER